jgi:hypothetical protein
VRLTSKHRPEFKPPVLGAEINFPSFDKLFPTQNSPVNILDNEVKL